MKNINKILGIVLTLALLAGSLMMAVPVSAANLAWTSYPVPDFYPGSCANMYDIAGDGKTIYMYNNTDYVLYKSTDSGANFAKITQDTKSLFDNVSAEIALTALAVCPDDATNLIATDGTTLYRSTNSGVLWKVFEPALSGAITSIDIASGPAYLVGTDTGEVWSWDNSNDWVQISTAAAGYTGTAVYGVKFAPGYADNSGLVVVAEESGAVVAESLTNDGDSDWNTLKVSEALGATPAADLRASIALPSNFSMINNVKFFVGCNDSGAIYMIQGKTTGTVSKVTTISEGDTGLTGVYSLALKGTTSSATLAAGDTVSPQVVTSANPYSTTPTFVYSVDAGEAPAPYGTENAMVKFQPGTDTLYVGTAGDASALFTSNGTTYSSFSGIGFYNCSDLANIGVNSINGAGTALQYWRVTDSGYMANGMLMTSTDSGASFKLLLNLYGSTYAKIDGYKVFGATIVVHQGAHAKTYLKSIDTGASWSSISISKGSETTAFGFIDANTYWQGTPSGVRKSTSTTFVSLNGETPGMIFDFGAWMWVGTAEGSVWYSTDGGASFTIAGDPGQFDTTFGVMGPPPNFDFVPPAQIIYIQDPDTGDIMSYTVGTSIDWKNELQSSALPAALTGVGAEFMGGKPDGFWYFRSIGNTAGQIWRSQDLVVAPNYCAVFNTTPTNMGGTIAGGPPFGVSPDASGNSLIATNVTLDAGKVPDGGYAAAYRNMTYTFSAAPAIVAPAANSSNPATVNFSWGAIPYAGPTKYDMQVAYDKDFKSLASNAAGETLNFSGADALSGTMKAGVIMSSGNYFWRVRLNSPGYTKWSDAIAFTVQPISVAVQGLDVTGRIYPENGATIASTNPAITWGTVTGATYDFKLATDSAFTNLVESQTGLATSVYSPVATLKPGTTYFWEVRAVVGNNTGAWVASAFTVAAAAVAPTATAPAAPVVNVTVPPISVPAATVNVSVPTSTGPAPAPVTPGYIWVIIIIGAVLVIAVIVLIVRTRKV